MLRSLFLMISFLICLSANGQLIDLYPKDENPDLSLLPVKKGRLYGFVDHKNVFKIPAEYEAVSFFDENGYALVSQYGLYGIIDKSGKIVVPFLSSRKTIKNVRSSTHYVDIDRKKYETRDNYFVVRNTKSKKWCLFKEQDKGLICSEVYSTERSPVRDKIPYYLSSLDETADFYYGYKRVVKDKRRVNFIDTSFNEVLNDDIYDGKPISSQRFCLFDEDQKAYLADRNGKAIGKGHFQNIEFTSVPNVFKVTAFNKISYSSAMGLIDDQGVLLVDTIYKSMKYLHKKLFAAQDENAMMGVIDIKGKTVLPFEYKSINVFTDNLYLGSKDNKHFVFDLQGKVVSGPYANLKRHYTYPLGIQSHNDTTTIVGEKGTELFQIPGNYSIIAQVKDALILSTGNNQYYLYDRKGKKIITQKMRRLDLTEVDGLMVAYHEDKKSMGIYSLKDKWVLSMGDYRIVNKPKSALNEIPSIVIQTKKERTIITDNWSNRVVEKIKDSNSSGYESRTDKTHKYITLDNGTEIKYPKKEKYRLKTNGHDIYFTQRDGNKWKLLNKDFQSMLPTGYGLSKEFDQGGNFYFLLSNDQNERGLIDFNGKWIFKPEKNKAINTLGDDLWLIGNHEELVIYDLDFKPISKEVYSSVSNNYQKIFDARKKPSPLVDIYNKKGELLSQGEYTGISQQGIDYVAVSKYIDDQLESCFLDTLGNVDLCLPFAEIYPIGFNDLVIAKDLYDYGIVDRAGKVLMDFKYKSIAFHPEIKLISLDKGNYVTDLLDTDLKPVLKDFKAYVKAKKHGEYAFTIRGEDETALFDINGKFINRFSNELGTMILQEAHLEQGIVWFSKKNEVAFANVVTGEVYK